VPKPPSEPGSIAPSERLQPKPHPFLERLAQPKLRSRRPSSLMTRRTASGPQQPTPRLYSTIEYVPCAAVASGSHGLPSMGFVPLRGLYRPLAAIQLAGWAPKCAALPAVDH
jgi:hypothetical protein